MNHPTGEPREWGKTGFGGWLGAATAGGGDGWGGLGMGDG
jgi:hypothetical protein